MKAGEPLPSLFGRFTAILKDHHHLRETLGRLRVMCSQLEGGQPTASAEESPPRLLAELRTDLGAHFAAEEGGDYFGTVVDEAPQLAAQIAELKAEHVTMLAMVDALTELATDPPCSPGVPTRARELISTLERHERAESVLLRGLFKGGN